MDPRPVPLFGGGARPPAPLVLAVFRTVARPLSPHGLRDGLYLPRDGLVRPGGAGARRARLVAPEISPRVGPPRPGVGDRVHTLEKRGPRERLRRPWHRDRRLL